MKINELIASAQALLVESNDLIEAGDTDGATAKQAEAAVIGEQIKALKAQEEMEANLKTFAQPEEPAKTSRMPFDTSEPDTDLDQGEPDVDATQKSVYLMRYGDSDAAEKAVTQDLYGKDYMGLRDLQWRAFAKYVVTGRMSAREEESLKSIVLLPDAIRAQVKSGRTIDEIKATLQEGINDLGGVLVPEDYRVDIIKRLAGMTVVRGRARQVNTIRDAAEWPKLEGGDSRYTSAVRVTWVDELPASATASQTNPTFGIMRVPVHTVMARTDVSRNMLEDTPFNTLQIVAELFSEAMAFDEDDKFLTGTGGGSPRGILGNRSGANQTPEDDIESVNSGAAAALTADGLVDLAYGLHAQYRKNAVMIGGRLTHRDIRKLKDGNGDYLWQRGLAAGEPPTLLSYPFEENEGMPSIAANNYPVIFGDLLGYLIVDRVGMSVERVSDTTTVGGNKVALFARRRLGGQVIEPWRFQGHKVSA